MSRNNHSVVWGILCLVLSTGLLALEPTRPVLGAPQLSKRKPKKGNTQLASADSSAPQPGKARSIDPPTLPLIEIDPRLAYEIPTRPLDQPFAGLASAMGSAGDRGCGSSNRPERKGPGCLGGDLVTVRVEVKDQSGWYVFNLLKDDFIIFEDGHEAQLFFFRRDIIDPNSPWLGYTMGFYPLNTSRDGSVRRIRVSVRDGKTRGLKARCYPRAYTLEPED